MSGRGLDLIPTVVFAHARPAHLARLLGCLRTDRVPRIIAFSDGPKTPALAGRVAEVRAMLRVIDWCEVELVEREENLGLGRSILTGVSAVAERHEAFVVWEDDLVCVSGTHAWMSAALRAYADDPRVMSVTGWTHPRVTPPGIGERPYFDAHAESWSWGTWARAWRGMTDEDALTKLRAAEARGIAAEAYGADLPRMAAEEMRKNLWAVRWMYHHLAHGGLCLHPPWSMVDHAGFDAEATHAAVAFGWDQSSLRAAPPIPAAWPEPAEHPGCRVLRRRAQPRGLGWFWHRARARLARILRG